MKGRMLTSVDDQILTVDWAAGKKWANKIWGSRYYNVFIPRPSKFSGYFHKNLNSVLRLHTILSSELDEIGKFCNLSQSFSPPQIYLQPKVFIFNVYPMTLLKTEQ